MAIAAYIRTIQQPPLGKLGFRDEEAATAGPSLHKK
jgi:hypothetical protein